MADRPIKVLVVDDSDNDFILLRRLFFEIEGGNYVVDRAKDYATGLEALIKNEHDVHLIDYRLGVHTGLDLLKEAIAQGCTAPLILLTGAGSHELDVAAMNVGAADYLIKSDINADLLERSIRYSIKNWNMMQKLRDSEARFKAKSQMLKSLLSHLPVIAGRIDAQGAITEAAGSGLNNFGMSSAWVVGKSVFETFPQASDHLKKALAGRSISFPLNGTHEDLDWYFENYFFHDTEKGSGAIFFAQDVTERKRLEKELLEISGEEQRRIGRDLHDGLGQYLTGVACLSRALQEKLEARSLPDAVDAAEVADLINESISQTRALARGLCPVELETHGLQAALEELSFNVQKLSKIACRVECEPAVICVPDVALHLYRIAQEAINNAIKHGRAKHIHISLKTADKLTTLAVKDDGVGFSDEAVKTHGMGLKMMKYRAGIIGGSLQVSRTRARGTTIVCDFQNRPPAS